MNTSDVLVLTASDVLSLISGRERELVKAVETAYTLHSQGESSLPHSTFLRFPDAPGNRIIALPAYLRLASGVAGLKWVSSFPGNIELGLERASAVIVLNSAQTGRPTVIMEGSIISAKRTAASAVLAACHLQSGREFDSIGIIGTGLINFEAVRFLLKVFEKLKTLVVFDLNASRAQQFREKCQETFDDVEVFVAEDIDTVLESSPLISIATTSLRPHISNLAACPGGSTILHISLRDLTPEVVLSSDNIVDDIDHVCRAQTSVHLAEQLVGRRDFIRGTLADVIGGSLSARKNEDNVVIFSPFGLGILDLAIGKLVLDLAIKEGRGTVIESFLPITT